MEFKRVATTSERLREAMELRDKKQVDLISITGIEKGALSRYISGKIEPKSDAVFKLAKALDVSEMWLWGYDTDMERPVEQIQADDIKEIIKALRKNDRLKTTVDYLLQLDNEQFVVVEAMINHLKKD